MSKLFATLVAALLSVASGQAEQPRRAAGLPLRFATFAQSRSPLLDDPGAMAYIAPSYAVTIVFRDRLTPRDQARLKHVNFKRYFLVGAFCGFGYSVGVCRIDTLTKQPRPFLGVEVTMRTESSLPTSSAFYHVVLVPKSLFFGKSVPHLVGLNIHN